MSEFPATDVALEGFRVTREQPRSVAVWGAVRIVASLIGLAAIVILAGHDMASVLAGARDGKSIDELARRAEPLLPVFLELAPLDLLVQTILLAACYRAVLRPGPTRIGYLRLGLDELRLLTVNLILLLGLFFGLVLARIVGEGVVLVAQMAGAPGRVLVVLYVATVLFGAAFLAVRFSLAPALTFMNGRITLMDSWRLTQGRHWILGGAYFMAFILSALVYVLGTVVGSVLQLLGTADSFDISALSSPGMLSSTAWMAVIGVLISVIIQAPGAAAARRLTALGRRV